MLASRLSFPRRDIGFEDQSPQQRHLVCWCRELPLQVHIVIRIYYFTLKKTPKGTVLLLSILSFVITAIYTFYSSFLKYLNYAMAICGWFSYENSLKYLNHFFQFTRRQFVSYLLHIHSIDFFFRISFKTYKNTISNTFFLFMDTTLPNRTIRTWYLTPLFLFSDS